MTLKKTLTKYFACGAAAALATVPLAASADMTSPTTAATTSVTMTTPDPTLVSGSVLRYYVNRAGFVTAMDVQTANGVQLVKFGPTRAARIYGLYPAGGNIDVWVMPAGNDGQWEAVGAGTERPAVWWAVQPISDVDWLKAEPYIQAGTKESSLRGNLKGTVVDPATREILALVLDTGQSNWALVRVPPEVRQIAPGHIGTSRVTPLFRHADVEVVGMNEAPRPGTLSPYNRRFAANTLRVDGDTVGAIGIALKHYRDKETLFNWNFGATDTAEQTRAAHRGYTVYMPATAAPADTASNMSSMAPAAAPTAAAAAATTTSMAKTERATGRVMVVKADGTSLPVVRRDGRLYARASDDSLTQINKQDGKYVVPESLTGARMMMVMADGRRLAMDTVNGQLMVITANGGMAPVTLHTP